MDWEQVDEELKKYLKEYRAEQLTLEDHIQSIFDRKFTNIQGYANKADLERFKRYVIENEELIKSNEYISYIALKYANKTKVQYKDILLVMLYIEYAMFEGNISANQLEALRNIASISSNYAERLLYKLGFKVPKDYEKKKKGWFYHDTFILALILTPLNTGLTFKEQNDSTAIYNAEEAYKLAMQDIAREKELKTTSPEFEKLFTNQKNKEIHFDTDKNKVSGYLDNMSTFVANQIMKEVYEAYGVEKVIFKSHNDDRTTEMCKSLNNQKFSMNEMNTYDRYSAVDKKNVIYHTQGLEVGQNLPPINNHFHWCRSHIEPYKEQ